MILLMGIAGSGKGTQGKRLADKLGFRLISMGDVLRMYVTGVQRQRMLAGNLLEDDEIIAIVDRVLKSIPNDDEVILDGFPRTVPQAQWLCEQVNAGRFELHNVFHLVASREAVKERLFSRGRIDDVEESIEERFRQYENSTHPVLDWLREQGIEVEDIDAERSIGAIHSDLVNRIK